jgi:hypothetical protein
LKEYEDLPFAGFYSSVWMLILVGRKLKYGLIDMIRICLSKVPRVPRNRHSNRLISSIDKLIGISANNYRSLMHGDPITATGFADN